MKTLYLIHHAHTDIGYTDRQTAIRRNHIDYIRQVLAILEERGPDSGFRWVCESFWSVEQFLAEAHKIEKSRFAQAIRSGAIGLSANYANFSELLDLDMISTLTARATGYGHDIGHDVRCAMTADINGFGWGFCKALHAQGVENLFTCIHTHHGMFPLRRHRPFWWSGPDGAKVLVWNGEHYHFGNELGLAPGATASYITKDECDAETIHHDPWRVATLRIPRLFADLARDGYPYDFLPVMISGLRTDNSPPSVAILDQMERWNREHGRQIRTEMVTLDQFFSRLRDEDIPIETHHGDWPDWWTDGVASMPDATSLFREAQRTRRTVLALDGRRSATETTSLEKRLEDNLALYAEHTYGHAASIVMPYHPLVQALALRKRSYASLADEDAQTLLADKLSGLGLATLAPGLPLRYRVLNPHPIPITGIARLQIEHHEYYENNIHRGVRVIDETGDTELPAGVCPTPVTTILLVPQSLDPGEEKTLRITPTLAREITPDKGGPALKTMEAVGDSGVFETDAFRLTWSIPEGITAWIDKIDGRDLLRGDRVRAPLIPVHSITPMEDPDTAWSIRSAMGLSRSGPNARWSTGRVIAVREHFSGVAPGDPVVGTGKQSSPIYRRLEMDIEVAGCSACTLQIEATAGVPQLDVEFQVNKENNTEPENLYLSLPFGDGPADTIWLDKAGGGVRARIDQLPGTLIDYYAVQDGYVCSPGDRQIKIAMRDNPLLQLGPLEYRDSRLRHEPDKPHPDPAHSYAWLMSNYWETNFAAGVGGFHNFRFSVSTSRDCDQYQALQQLRTASVGLVCYRLAF